MSKVFPDASFGPEAACVDDDAYDAELAALPELCEFSFGVWHRHSPSRRELYRVLKSKKFDALILFFIFFNTLCMAMTDYRKGCMGRNSRAADFGAPDQSRCGQNRFVTFMNSPVFFVVFLAEVVLKLGALGAYFEGANTFFRDAWNILDFVCVSAAVLDELEVKAVGKLSTLRLFRILRPLKSLSKLKGLKKIVVTLLEALPNLREVVILLAVLLLVFAIALMQFYSGNLHYRCRITAHPTSVPALWYRTAPCFRGQNVSALAECFHGRYFPTAPEFEDYRYAMLLREEAAAETFGSQGSPSIQEMALRWNWGSEMGKHIAWTCSSPDFPASSYPGGIPTTDTYPRKYSGRFDDGEALTSDGKRWKRPRRCLWLVDEADVRICSRNGLTGAHKCFGDVRQQRRLYATAEGYANARDPSNCSFDAVGPRRVQRGELGLGPTHCGSNYDEFGSRRFKFAPILYERPRAARSVPGAMKRWQRFSPGFYKTAFPEFIPDLNFGYSNFDHVGVAWTTLFQAVTMEGWTDIMYMCMDSDLPVVAITLFVLLFMIGSMLVLNLVLGVITDTISDEAAASELEQADELDAASAAFPLPLRQNAQVAHGSTVEVAHGSTVEAAHGSTAQDVPDFKFIEARPKTPVLMPSHRPFFLPRRLERPASAALPGLGARAWLGALVTNFWFSAFIYACIFLNTAALCADEYPVTLQFATIMDFVNVVLALIFVAEMVIKLLAFGFEAYWSDAFNRFDGFIVVVSVASMGLAAASINFGSAAVSAMRCFRVFRIFKLAKNWPSLQLLLLTMYKTAQDIVNFAVLLFLFVLIFALWGMQAFANNLNFDPETHGKIKFSTRFGDDGGGGGAFSKSHAARRGRKKSYYLSANTGYSRRKLAPEFKAATPPPLNFDDFGAAMVTVFGILTGESWNLVMYDLMRGRGFEYGFIFMFATQLILVFCIMNLFLAILLANFSNNDELVPSQSPSFRDSMRGIARGFSALSLKSLHKMQDEQCELQKSKKHLSKRAWVSIRDGSLGEGPVGDELPKTARAPRLSRGSNKNDVGPFYDRGRRDEKKDGQPTCSNGPTLKPPDGTLSRDSKPAPRDDGDGIESDSDSAPTFQTRGRVGNRGWVSQKPKWPRWPNCAEDRSLCLFSKTHALRRVCLKVAESAHFDTCIVATILLSSFMLSIGGPLWDQKAVLMRTFVYLDDVFNAIFFTECGIKVVATGFAFNGPASYLRNSWNLLDFMIVAASAASYASLDGLTALKALRVVRVIRPLRMLSRSPGLKVVLSSLIQGIQGAVNVTMVCILFFFIFAIMGVGFFKGTMDACDTVNFPLASISLQRFIDDPVHLRKAVKSGLYDELMRSTKNQSTCFLDFDAAFINRKDYFNPKTNVASDFAVHKEDMLRRALPLLSSHFTTRRKKGPTGAKSGQRVQSAVQGLSPETSKFFAERPHYGGAALRDSKAWLSNHGNIDYYVPTSKDMCACLLNAESAWRNPLYMNFDTVPNAFSLLFEIYSTEGWLDYMFWNADANGAEMQPIRDHGFRTKRRSGPRFYAFGYHIAFQLLGGFFAMQLFVGVIIEQFSKLREEQLRSGRSSMLLTASQSHWVKTQTFIATKVQPRRTLTPKVVAFFNLVEGSATKDKFEGGIMLCILANGVVMASTHFGQSRASSTALTGLNTAFAGIFTLEAILKVGAVGFADYWCDHWNKFDLVIVLGTTGGLLMTYAFDFQIGPVASVLRLFRILRIIRLFNQWKNMKRQVGTLLAALPQMANVGVVLILAIYIFAILLVEQFSAIGYNDTVTPMANFQHVPVAILTLLRFTTGENWNGFMHEMDKQWASSGCWGPKQFKKIRDRMYLGGEAGAWWHDKWCTNLDGGDREVCPCESFERDGAVKTLCQKFARFEKCCVPLSACGNQYYAGVIIHTFDLLVTCIVFNLFVGIILDAYGQEDDEEHLGLDDAKLDAFVRDWCRVDKSRCWSVDLDQLKTLLQLLDTPMGFGEYDIASDAELVGAMLGLGLEFRPGAGHRFHIMDVSLALGRRVLANELGEDIAEFKHGQLPRPRQTEGIQFQDADAAIREHFGFQPKNRNSEASLRPRTDAAKVLASLTSLSADSDPSPPYHFPRSAAPAAAAPTSEAAAEAAEAAESPLIDGSDGSTSAVSTAPTVSEAQPSPGAVRSPRQRQSSIRGLVPLDDSPSCTAPLRD